MTTYELLDLRISVTQNMANGFRWWISITFAVLTAAFFAGDQLGMVGAVAIITLYTATSLINFMIWRAYLAFGASLQLDAETMLATQDDPLNSLKLLVSSDRTTLYRLYIGLRILTFMVTVLYVLYRGGFLG
ncbi:MAG: hypothetical protein V3R73_05345 [Sphingomonadales bacterium]